MRHRSKGTKRSGNTNASKDPRVRRGAATELDLESLLGRGLHEVNGRIEIKLADGAMGFTARDEVDWFSLPPLESQSPARIRLDETLQINPKTRRLGARPDSIVRAGEGVTVLDGRVSMLFNADQFEAVPTKAGAEIRSKTKPALAALDPLNMTVSDPPTQGQVQAIADRYDALLAALKQ